ncbi:GNAT family N-acetyltransferase [Capnocytophaga canimorsus]|nr:GNAT family N-acetyltransferase [Capnocytophaga canimorsus]WGU67710.1 GNAT family N-acetyltransferase [Capnocytophaga canimorsus]WGU71167.1 GNAT family N-acetyltransferase [Capnocytophaga canimorsus]
MEIQQAESSHFNEIAKMMEDFNFIEWKGKNKKQYSDYFAQVSKSNENIGIIKKYSNNEIVGYYTFIDKDMIGTIYIKEEHRDKKFGQIVLSKMTKMLLSNSSKVKVMTTKENEPMKTILKKVGYKEHCKHLEIYKLKS